MTTGLTGLAERLTRPHPQVVDLHLNRILRLVAAWHLLTVPLGPILAGLQVLAGEGERVSALWLVVAPLITIANYFLARSRFGREALWFQVWTTFIIVVAAIHVSPDRNAPEFALILPVLAAALCFELREVLFMQGAALAVVVYYAATDESGELGRLIGTGIVLIAGFAIIAALVRHRVWLHERTVRQLRQEALRARAILEANFDGTAQVVNGVFVSVSEGFCRVLDCQETQLVGRRVNEGMPIKLEDGQKREEAIPFVDGTGSIRYVTAIREEIPSDPGKHAEVIALRDQTRELLERGSMQFADRMVSIGSISAGVAHEVNNALMSLLGHAEVSEQAFANGNAERAEQGLIAMKLAGKRIETYIAELQRFGGGAEGDEGPCDMNETVRATLRLARYRLQHISRLEVDLADDLPLCLAPEAKLGQIIMNLLLNAGEALRGREDTEIRLVTRSVDGELQLRVSDNGPGVPEADVALIFQPFFSRRNQGVGGQTGTGLGLPLSVSIATQLEGSLVLEESEVGASFCLGLPATSSESNKTVTSPSVIKRTSGRCLVVDDDPDVTLVLARLLEPAEVLRAASVDEAVDLLEGDFDLVLSDIVMPGRSGLDLRTWLVEHRPDLLARFVLMTGSALDHQAALHELGSDQVTLTKPVDIKKLRTLIATVSSITPPEALKSNVKRT